MADFDEYFYKNITTSLEQKSSIDEIQMSRKQRYYQRLNRPKPPTEDVITKKRKKLWVKDDSDDEMPKATPKIKRPRKKAAPTENSVEVIVLDDDMETTSSSSSEPPATSKPTPEAPKEQKVENTDPVVKDMEDKTTAPAIQDIDEEPPKMTPHELRLRGRLPTWYHERQAHRAALLQKNLERKEIRLKMEKEMAEKQAEEDKKEERRRRDRERKREKTILKKIGDGGGGKKKDLKAIVRENNQNLDEKLERKRKGQEKHMITDPSLDPSLISLGAPEIVPWAPKRQPTQPPKKTSPASSLPSTSSSSSESDDLQPQEEVPMEFMEEMEEDPGAQNLEDNLFEPVDFADMMIASPTPLLPTLDGDNADPLARAGNFAGLLEDPDAVILDPESPIYFNIGEEVLDVTENDIEPVDLDDNFLSLMNDDSILLDPVYAFNRLS